MRKHPGKPSGRRGAAFLMLVVVVVLVVIAATKTLVTSEVVARRGENTALETSDLLAAIQFAKSIDLSSGQAIELPVSEGQSVLIEERVEVQRQDGNYTAKLFRGSSVVAEVSRSQ